MFELLAKQTEIIEELAELLKEVTALLSQHIEVAEYEEKIKEILK